MDRDITSTSQLVRVQRALCQTESFLRRYAPLVNAHTNDFLTHDLWRLLPPALADELLAVADWHEIPRRCLEYRQRDSTDLPPTEDAACFPNGVFDKSAPCRWLPEHAESLQSFLAAAAASSLDALDVLSPLSAEPGEEQNLPPSMGEKKWHEVERMAAFTAALCRRLNLRSVVDVGSGKGYLGTHLNHTAGLQVVEFDAEVTNTQGAELRRQRLAVRRRGEATGDAAVTAVTGMVDSAAKLDHLLSLHLPGQQAVMTGLHTCGYLAMCAVETFLSSTGARALVNVGCCYHLLDESAVVDTYVKHKPVPGAPTFPMSEWLRGRRSPTPFALGRNARMIAAQSVDRLASSEESLHSHMFYRVVLQKLMMEKLGDTRDDWIVGKLGKKGTEMSFTTYVRKALAKLRLHSLSEKLSDEEIKTYEMKWSTMEKNFYLFYVLRCCLGPVVEACVLLDRLCFLLERSGEDKPIFEAHLLKLFDPAKSPRCYAIFAVKEAS